MLVSRAAHGGGHVQEAAGRLSFTNCLVDGKALAAAHPAKNQRVNGSTVQITTGALSSAGTAFATHFKHS